MAEIGLAASVLGVASFGIQVAKGLYDASDAMLHAREQLTHMAKHVSQFTAVLRHLARVLNTDADICSDEMRRDIRKINRSCKTTFREIRATAKSRILPLKWIFRRSKARELEARLDTEKLTLQVMISVVTLAKLGRSNEKPEESVGITDIRTEFDVLKTYLKDHINNVTELKEAERAAEVEAERFPPVAPPPTYSLLHKVPNPEPQSCSDESTDESDDAEKDKTDQGGTGAKPSGAADLLMQMVPSPSRPSMKLLGGPVEEQAAARSAAMHQTTRSVRLLLDKWTTPGSKPLSDMLDEEAAKDAEEGNIFRDGVPFESIPRFPQYEPGYIPPYGADYRPGDYRAPLSPPGPFRVQSTYGHPMETTRDVWKLPYSSNQPPRHSVGDSLMSAIRSIRGGIMYSKRSAFQHMVYVDERECFRFNLVPESLIPTSGNEPQETILGTSIVRQKAIDLFGYEYQKYGSGEFLIEGNLHFDEIEELVRLSFQALTSDLEKLSRQVIRQRGLVESVAALQRDSIRPEYPYTRQYHPFAPDEHARYHPPRHFRSRARSPSRERWREYDDLSSGGESRAPSYARRRTNVPGPGLSGRPIDFTEGTNPANASNAVVKQDLRFTISEKGPSPARSGRPEQPIERTSDPETPRTGQSEAPKDVANQSNAHSAHSALESEIRKAQEKLAILLKRLAEYEARKDFAMASDLKYYVIPETEKNIGNLQEKKEAAWQTMVAQLKRERERDRHLGAPSQNADRKAQVEEEDSGEESD